MAIAEKLQADITSGRGHSLAVFRYQGKHIAQFGIRRASRDKGHDYIPKQLFISQGQCREFRQCSLTLEAYVDILVAKGYVVREIHRSGDLRISLGEDCLDIECELNDEPDDEWVRDFDAGPPEPTHPIIHASLTSRTARFKAEKGQSRESIEVVIHERIEHANRNAAKRAAGPHRQA